MEVGGVLLNEKKLRVNLGNYSSWEFVVTSRVPQGANNYIPLMFVIFIHDIIL